MANGIRTGKPHGFNKGRSSKIWVGSWVQQTPEEGRRTYWPKRCGNNNKDEDNSPKTLSWLALLFKHFFIKIQPNMSEQKKKQQRTYDLLHVETKPKKLPK